MSHQKLLWVFQTGEPLPIDEGGTRAMRAMSLTDALLEMGHRVILWSADFNHSQHQHRFDTRTRIRVSDRLEVRLLASPGYEDNLGLGRVWDHFQLAMDLRRVLKHERPPDAAFVGFPPIEPASYMAEWLSRRDVPFMVDVKDAWPDIFARALPERVRLLGQGALAPHYWMTRRCLRQATALCSISDDFLSWSARRAGRCQSPQDVVAPLTAPPPAGVEISREDHDYWDGHGVLDDGSFRVSFVGTLHSSYDWAPVAEAARRTGIQVVIGGDGSQGAHVRSLMGGMDNVVMPGWLTAGQAAALALRSSLALAPIAPHPDYVMSVPNKFYDAWAKGLPMVTGLPGTAARVIRTNGVGVVYGEDSGESLGDALLRLRSDPSGVREMSRRARALYEGEFNHAQVYRSLACALVGLTKKSSSLDLREPGEEVTVTGRQFPHSRTPILGQGA